MEGKGGGEIGLRSRWGREMMKMMGMKHARYDRARGKQQLMDGGEKGLCVYVCITMVLKMRV